MLTWKREITIDQCSALLFKRLMPRTRGECRGEGKTQTHRKVPYPHTPILPYPPSSYFPSISFNHAAKSLFNSSDATSVGSN